MNRWKSFFSQPNAGTDWFGISIIALVLVLAAWTASILFFTSMREMALRRFHLAAESYPLWAAHQMVPAMYNFQNRIQFCNQISTDGAFPADHPTYQTKTLNHFPARFVTFGHFRHELFSQHRQAMFEMSSKYRGLTLYTRWQVVPNEENVLVIQRKFSRLEKEQPVQQPRN